MTCAIHHGGGVGTYKTFSVLQRHAIPQLLNGRVVVSTVRGFDSIRVIEAVLDIEIPESAKIIYVDLETTEGIDKIRRWWEWVPEGAYIIIDEAQLIYPKSKRIASYDYPEKEGRTSAESAEIDNRPNGFLQAFTMHRHYNWDLVVITPHIKMLVPEIKEVSQVAYEHKYMGALLPWAKHGWREIQHSPLETGKGSAHPPVRYTADRRIYKVYKSTKTGNHSDGNSERSIFQNPKVISTFGIIFLSISLFFWLLFTQILKPKNAVAAEENSLPVVQIPNIAGANNGINSNDVQIDSIQHSLEPVPIETTKFHSATMAIVGKFFDEYTIEIGLPPNAVQFSTGYLFRNGVELNIISDCHIQMTFNDVLYNVRCPLHKRKSEPVEKDNTIRVAPFGALTGA